MEIDVLQFIIKLIISPNLQGINQPGKAILKKRNQMIKMLSKN